MRASQQYQTPLPFHSPSPTTSSLPLPAHLSPPRPPPPHSPFQSHESRSGGVVWRGGGHSTYQISLVFCRLSDTAERALRHPHMRSIRPKCTPTSFAHVGKSGTAAAPRGKSGILTKKAFVLVGVRGFSEIQQHAKYLCKRLRFHFFDV